jgi:hypothetical protein
VDRSKNRAAIRNAPIGADSISLAIHFARSTAPAGATL